MKIIICLSQFASKPPDCWWDTSCLSVIDDFVEWIAKELDYEVWEDEEED